VYLVGTMLHKAPYPDDDPNLPLYQICPELARRGRARNPGSQRLLASKPAPETRETQREAGSPRIEVVLPWSPYAEGLVYNLS